MRLASAANLLTPAYLTLLDRGYDLRQEGDLLIAARGGDTFMAEDPITLLGVIAIAEARGENWQATDKQIDEFLVRFG
ncbi:MAG TPA: hypothetical protein VKQ70_12970 [Caulobacteraceae bacterium]|jgi:hypothetical protein|nr:hypothetical protein [Caulobacteraceae bacterium]